jgi:thiol-disulfide isomerase/thioredoxin
MAVRTRFIISLAWLCFALQGCTRPAGDLATDSSEAAHPLVGQAAPQFTATFLDGSPFDLAQQQGKVVILDFWATWCGPCRAALPTLSEVAAEYRDRGVVFFAVDLGESPEEIKPFLDQSGLDLTVVLDRDGAIAKQYLVEGIPQTVILDQQGKVRFVHVGLSDDLRQRLSRELDELIAETPADSAKSAAPEQPPAADPAS